MCIVEYISYKSMIYSFYVQGLMFYYLFIPSTSALDTIVNSTTSFDEQEHFGTQNKDYLDSELNVEVIESSSMSSDNLPDLEITFKDESSDNDQGVTVFRALNEDDRKKTRRRSRRGKFETVDMASSCSDSE